MEGLFTELRAEEVIESWADQGAKPTTASTEDFEWHRSLLFSIAYRMLGSVAEAEDVVQEAYLRWREVPFASF